MFGRLPRVTFNPHRNFAQRSFSASARAAVALSSSEAGQESGQQGNQQRFGYISCIV
jgi:hypothetical protein